MAKPSANTSSTRPPSCRSDRAGPVPRRGLRRRRLACEGKSRACCATTRHGGVPLRAPLAALAMTEPMQDAEARSPGTRIGPYKLLEEIGEGGMGVVYMAEQVEPVRRQVALEDHQAGDGHEAGDRPVRGRAAGAGADGPPQHRAGARRRHHRHRPALLRHGAGPGHPDHRVLRQGPASHPRAAGAVRLRLPGRAARAPEGDHPPRPQAVERPGHGARRRRRCPR